MTQVLNDPREAQEVHRQRMSYEDYLTYGNDTTRSEWVDGEIIVYMPPKTEHQLILAFLERLLALFVGLNHAGGVYLAPFEVKLWEGGPSREPDIFFVSEKRLELLNPKRFEGAPDLVVEVISPSSLYIDRDKKFREYEQAGVKEYWLIDSRPGQKRADFYRLDDEKRYALFATESDEKVTSKVLEGFWLRPTWLWQEVLPNPLTVLAEVAGQDAIIAALKAPDPANSDNTDSGNAATEDTDTDTQ